MPHVRSALDRLDEDYRALQDDLSDAQHSGDEDQAALVRDQAVALMAEDADGVHWHIHAPPAVVKNMPFYRFHYRYWGGLTGEEKRPLSRSRFAAAPSLALTYGERLGTKGWLAGVVRNVEALGYVGGIAVALGLWFLLGDLIGSLPEWAAFAGLVVLAIGLWVATVWLAQIGYREAKRLAIVTRAAAVGVTASLPWVATIDASWITDTGRVAITAYVLTLAAGVSYARTPSLLTYLLSIAGWIVALGSTSSILLEEIGSSSFGFFSAQPGLVVAIGVAFPLATMFGAVRWIPGTTITLAAVGWLVIIVTAVESATTSEAFVTIVLGAAAACGAFFSRRYLRKPMRWFHIWSAVGLATSAGFVALAKAPWDVLETLFDWLSDVPLPVWLVTGGSALLIGVAWAIRLAVRRVSKVEEEHAAAD